MNVSGYSSPQLRISLSNMGETEELTVYIWNISQGGKTRNPSEYRIQMKGSGLVVNGFKTLLLGWFDEERVFAAFDAFKHRSFGRSPSVQIPRETLHNAVEHGIAFHTKHIKGGLETVVAFKPSYIMEYIREIYPQYHKNGERRISEAEMRAVERPLDRQIPEAVLNTVPSERKTIVQTLNKKVRDFKFQKDIFALYGGKCAICGLQARLTEAAHIIPVKDDGSDDRRNGVLLCRNHHKAYDSGLLAINGEYEIILNQNQVKRLAEMSLSNNLEQFIKSSRIGEKIALPADSRFNPSQKSLMENCKSKGI